MARPRRSGYQHTAPAFERAPRMRRWRERLARIQAEAQALYAEADTMNRDGIGGNQLVAGSYAILSESSKMLRQTR